jgi:hypothetical protein
VPRSGRPEAAAGLACPGRPEIRTPVRCQGVQRRSAARGKVLLERDRRSRKIEIMKAEKRGGFYPYKWSPVRSWSGQVCRPAAEPRTSGEACGTGSPEPLGALVGLHVLQTGHGARVWSIAGTALAETGGATWQPLEAASPTDVRLAGGPSRATRVVPCSEPEVPEYAFCPEAWYLHEAELESRRA